MPVPPTKPIRRTTYTLIFLIAVLIGLYLAKFTEPLSASWLLLASVLAPLLVKRGAVLIAYLLLAGVLIGWWRGGMLQVQNQKYYDVYYSTVELETRATEDSYYADKGQLEFMVESVKADGISLPGKIRVRGYGEAMVYRHDIVKVRGKLYPASGSKQASVYYAEISVIARADSRIEDFRRSFIAGVESALPEPAASLGVGLLVGQRSLLPDDVALMLTLVGLTHIVAVSGYNLTIITNAARKTLHKLSRFQTLAISMVLIYLFLIITGFSPSIVRAAIVAGLSLLTWYFGRSFRPLLLIALAAVITGFINPYYIWGDIGWYLSFLAFFGVLVIAPLLSIRFFGFREMPLIGSVAIESFSAQIMTMPFIMLIFSRISLVGFIANIIIVPMVPFAMLFTVIAGLAGMYIPSIAGWLAIPARLVLNVMLWLSAWMSHWPGAQAGIAISLAGLALMYVVICVVILGLRKRVQSVTIEQRRTKLSEV